MCVWHVCPAIDGYVWMLKEKWSMERTNMKVHPSAYYEALDVWVLLFHQSNNIKDNCSHLPSEWRDSGNVSAANCFLLPICDKNHWRLLLVNPDKTSVTVYDSWPVTSAEPWLDDHVMLLLHTEPPKMPTDRDVLPRILVPFVFKQTLNTQVGVLHMVNVINNNLAIIIVVYGYYTT